MDIDSPALEVDETMPAIPIPIELLDVEETLPAGCKVPIVKESRPEE
jgi:hypothetical protein